MAVKTKNRALAFLTDNSDSARKQAVTCLVAAGILLLGVYLSELFHLLEKPLFSKVYYGNLNSTFFAGFSAVYIFAFTCVFAKKLRQKTGISFFWRHTEPVGLKRKSILYVMTIIPVLIVGLALGGRFKLVYELGERVTGITLLGNASGYVATAAKLFSAVFFIFLIEEAVDALLPARRSFPFGGIAAMLTYGVLELIFAPSVFSLLYMFLFFYFGVVALVSQRRFTVTYSISLILYIL